MKKRLISIVIALEFWVVISIPIFTINWKQGAISEKENRVLAKFPNLFEENGELTANYLEKFNNWFEDNIGMRDFMMNLSSIINYNVFHQSTTDKVEIGKDGWLYYTYEDNLNIAKGKYDYLKEEVLEEFCTELKKVEERLRAEGKEFIVCFPPSKVSIYPEYIESGDFAIQESPVDILEDYIESHSDVKVIRLKDRLVRQKNDSNELLYFKTDTHWNAYGRYLAYEQIVEDFNRWKIINSDPVNVNFSDMGPFSGDLSVMLGVINIHGGYISEKYYKNIELIIPQAEEIMSGEKYDLLSNLKCDIQGNLWENPHIINGKKLLIYGDSMFGAAPGSTNQVASLLAENFSEVSFAWSYYLDDSMIDGMNPDVVLLEISERQLSAVLSDLFSDYLKTEYLLDKDERTLDIWYYDQGQLAQMYFPVWSQDEGQNDLIWYQAERNDKDTWHVHVDLDNHLSNDAYLIHFYDGPNGMGRYIYSSVYNVGKIY